MLYNIVLIVNNKVYFPLMHVKRTVLMLSVLYHIHTHPGKFLEVMDMFNILIVMMVSQVYVHVQTEENVYIKYMQTFVYQL